MNGLLDTIASVVALHVDGLAAWYETDPGRVDADRDPASILLAQHYCNFRLWNLEDQARRRDVDDSTIARIKRDIDGWNQRRNDLVERLDECILSALDASPARDADQHSETAGMMIDRLSILSLKVHHMAINAARTDDAELAAACAEKLATLTFQREDLQGCLVDLIAACHAGRRYFKVYRQHKAYNDARLNPALSSTRRS